MKKALNAQSRLVDGDQLCVVKSMGSADGAESVGRLVGQRLAEVYQMHFRDGELALDRLFKGLQLRLWVSRPNFVNGSARSLSSYVSRSMSLGLSV